MVIVIVLTIIAGILGGIGNWLMGATPATQVPLDQEIPSVPLWRQLLSCVTLGIIAASLIPLFLSMAKSDLLASATGASVDTSKAGIDCFVYFGFCLVAAITSRNFIDTVASRALRLAGDNEQKVAQISRNMEEITAGQEEPEPSVIERGLTDPTLEAPTDSKTLVLNAVALHPRFTRRNVSAISQETGLPIDEVNALLQQLSSEGLVENKTSTDGRILWMATKRGRTSLN